MGLLVGGAIVTDGFCFVSLPVRLGCNDIMTLEMSRPY